jgi:lipoate-protein ligase A
MTDTWRCLFTPPARGAWNMAVDEAILETAGRGESLPTLRLYAWEPACLSLGYAQSCQDVDRARLQERGWEVVRRATGGRAILHVDELTYSVTAPPNEPRVLCSGELLQVGWCVGQRRACPRAACGDGVKCHLSCFCQGPGLF